MNIFIMTDLEGICGIYCREQMTPGERRFDEARRFMTDDINVTARALKEAGIEKIYVYDAHGGSYSVQWERVSSDVDYMICGMAGLRRMPGIEDCDGVILLGYHAMAGTEGAVLEHTMSSASVQNYWINGEKAGETAVDACICADFGKPVIMVSGDDKLCAEAKKLLPWVTAAEVKKGLTWQGAMLLPKEKAHAVLFESAKSAVKNIADTKPLEYVKPVTFRVEVTERSGKPSPVGRPNLRIIDGRTYEVTAQSMYEALYSTF